MNRQTEGHDDLREIAHQAMIDRGLEPDFPKDALSQAAALKGPCQESDKDIRDLRELPWCSIDNDDSRDLDQLTVSQPGNGGVRILVAIADVDCLVTKGSAVDRHAEKNTTSVYTPGIIFSMLPERLSTDLTSLNENEDRLSMVIDVIVSEDGMFAVSDVYRGLVRNKAKLAYRGVGGWLEGHSDPPPKVVETKMEDQLRTQDRVAQQLRENRHEHGALELETLEPRAVMKDGKVADLEIEARNHARDLIEDFMIAANGVVARFLHDKAYSTIRRVVREPERWNRIVALAEAHGDRLPSEPDSKALEEFLVRQRKQDKVRFPDLSLAIVKLMGRGEYVLERPNEEGPGHFGLAVRDYAHSTAPNRRYPDLITQRIVKAALKGAPAPYSDDELAQLAQHCTDQEDAAAKVERQIRKSAAAQLLENRVGERFDGIVTGASEKGTWVRIFKPPVEGRVMHGQQNLDVGDRVRVKLIDTDVDRGFIDFVRT
ncbi:MAG TPA: RNB domain-containing ribonuclease [Thermoanaerobaculia bacterium]|nr:RNB domain-containing ribonuclease [Thermoanaerobaculia bacterium]